MDSDVVALNPSASDKSIRRLHSVTSSNGGERTSEVEERVRGLKDLIITLLGEVQALEHDELLLELKAPEELRSLDIERGIKFDDVVRRFESSIIRRALQLTGGNQARAARLLGIKANTLNYKVKLYNLL